MSVQYRGTTPTRNYSLNDFYNKGIFVSWATKFRDHYSKLPMLRCIFRSNGLMAEIRTCCNGLTFAVDVKWAWGEDRCITTECKTLREAKSILFQWFMENGYKSKPSTDWRKEYLSVKGMQLNLNPFIFRYPTNSPQKIQRL